MALYRLRRSMALIICPELRIETMPLREAASSALGFDPADRRAYRVKIAGRQTDEPMQLEERQFPMDRTVKNLCHLIRFLAIATNRSPHTISRLTTGSGDTISRLEKLMRPAHRITTDRVHRAMQRLSDIWDEDREPWPSDIPRPPNRRRSRDDLSPGSKGAAAGGGDRLAQSEDIAS